MENINIQTSQNVLIRQNLASVGERMLATGVDYLILTATYIAIYFLVHWLIPSSNRDVVITLLILPLMFYTLVSEILMHGQTLGKKWLKIQVVKIDGTQPNAGNYLVRWMFRLIDIFMLTGSVAVVTVIMNGKGQRFGDIVAKTSVISLKSKASLNNTIYVETPKDYKLNFKGSENLTESDIKTILEVLRHYNKNISSHQASVLIRETTEIIQQKIGATHTTNPLDFLRRVVYDFNLLHKVEKK